MEPLSHLAQVLRWTKASSPTCLRRCYEFKLRGCLADLCGLFANGNDLWSAFNLLEEQKQTAFLTSPAVAAFLTGGMPSQSASVIPALAQLLLADIQMSDNGLSSRGMSYADKTLSIGTVIKAVDHQSCQDLTGIDFDLRSSGNLNESQLMRVMAGIREASGLLQGAAPLAAMLIREYVEVLVLRRSEDPKFLSSSFSRKIGLVLLTNPNLENVDQYVLADALLHEAIHSILYVYEFVLGDFIVNPQSAPDRVTSPWTGAELPLRSYIHACIVWYGLYWFWHCVHDSGMGERARKFRDRSRRGFLARPVTRGLKNGLPALSREIVNVLGTIESVMC